MELFEQIRREYTYGAGTIQGVSRKLSVHRRMVRQALANAVPPERKQPVRRKPALDPVMNFIDAILVADELAPRKQRHTARRIWQRIRRERTVMLSHRLPSGLLERCGRNHRLRAHRRRA